MNIRILRKNVALLCITMVLVASVQTAWSDNILPPLVQLYETELSLLTDPEQTDQVVNISGTINEGGHSLYLLSCWLWFGQSRH